MRNCKILQNIKRFHKTNDISWNFRGMILCFHSVVLYFVVFLLTFSTFKRCFQKMTAKFCFVQTNSKFWSFVLGNDESYKSQNHSYLVLSAENLANSKRRSTVLNPFTQCPLLLYDSTLSLLKLENVLNVWKRSCLKYLLVDSERISQFCFKTYFFHWYCERK
jgi:hypothetical protein